MKFPLVKDIATTSVILISIKCFVKEALDLMLQENHRNAIVVDGDCFRILTVVDILNLKKDKQTIDTKLQNLNLSKIPTIDKDKNVLDTIDYLNNSVEHICVLNKDDTFYGLITHTDIISNIDPDTLMDNYRLSSFLKYGRRMKLVGKETKTYKLLENMINETNDHVIVVEDSKPIGVLTTKDVMKILNNNSDLSLSVENYMSSPVDTINKNSSIKKALNFLKQNHYKRVIVVEDNGDIYGVVSQKELISLSYSRWTLLMKEHQEELNEINAILENKNKKFETLASTDSLTGLYNRYKFSELYISSYTSMIQRHNKMSLILLDIDFFKKVNDTYGHNRGDQVLIQISHTLLRTLRNIDIICRWGGEEFVAILPTAPLDIANMIAEKIRKSIEELEIDVVGKVNASFGVAEVKEGESMEDVVDRADKALYLAKDSGRNCVKTELDI